MSDTKSIQTPPVVKPVPSFPGYFADTDGNILSRHGRGRCLKKQTEVSDGYVVTGLHSNGRRRSSFVHKIVAMTFLGPRPEGLEIAHLNGNPKDNRPANLAYCTSKQNHAMRGSHGTAARCENNGRAILTSADASIIRALAGDEIPTREWARVFGVTRYTIRDIMTGRSWKFANMGTYYRGPQ